MATLNPHFSKLKNSYIFPMIEEKLEEYKKLHPDVEILNLGVGDVAFPLAKAIASAICAAVQEMTTHTRGYGPSSGHAFLREAICSNEYAQYGITPDEVFISDGTNSDASSIQELFASSSVVAISDPSYPVYVDANIIAGKEILLIPTTDQEDFIFRPPQEHADLVYLCTPSNPTGVALTRAHLQEWIDWAKKEKAILIIDNVYHAFISSEEIPSSIYELKGAKEVAIEARSFSKTAGFTGLRCGYMVLPKTLHIPNLHSMWERRTSAKSNGVSYPIQRGAEACFSKQGKEEIQAQIAHYASSANILRQTLQKQNQTFYGGIHSPYIFWKTPEGMSSWEFFDKLLETCQIVAIPGSGFGPSGEGYLRLSCFISEEVAKRASQKIEKLCAM